MKLDNSFSPKHTFFTSDTHFFHSRVIKYCNRPFESVEQMNEMLIKNWNDMVKTSDTVFHLGDFCFGGVDKWAEILDRLNGKIYLVTSNHDQKQPRRLKDRFEAVADQMLINIGGYDVILNHCPFLTFGDWKRNVLQLHGHIHTVADDTSSVIDEARMEMLLPTQYDVGVDNNGFRPVSFEKVERIIQERRVKMGLGEYRIFQPIRVRHK